MPKFIKVRIESSGHIHPDTDDKTQTMPEGGALLVWPTPAGENTLHLSESSLAKDWLRPEEDAAWAHLQPDK